MKTFGRSSFNLLAIVLFSLFGLFGNTYKYEFFFSLDFLFGSIFSVLAILFFGTRGIFVGFTASLYTYVLWNHPYAIIVFTCEAIFLAVFRKNSSNIILTDLIYWLVCGIPLMFISYYLVMGLSVNSVVLIMIKQSINGVLSALIASVIFDVYMYLFAGRGKQRFSYEHLVFQIIVFIVMVPMVIYAVYSVRSGTALLASEMRQDLNSMTGAVHTAMNDFMEDNISRVDMVSEIYYNHRQSNDYIRFLLSKELQKFLTTSRHFISMNILNDNFISEIGAGYLDGMPDIRRGKDYSALFKEDISWESDKLYVSNVYMNDEFGIENPVIYILKPVKGDDGSVKAYAQGTLDFRNVIKMINRVTKDSGVKVTVVDRKGYVMFSTGDAFMPGDKWVERSAGGMLTSYENGMKLYTPRPESNISVMTKWQNSLFTKTVTLSEEIPYTIVTDLALGSYVSNVKAAVRRILTILFTTMIVSVALAQYLSLKITRQLSQLSRVSLNLPEKISRGEEAEWPESSMDEVHQIKENFRQMSEELKNRFSQLREQAEELTTLLDNIPLYIILKDTGNRVLKANKTTADRLGVKADDIVGMLSDDVFVGHKYGELDREVIETRQPKLSYISKYRFSPEDEMIARASKIPVQDESGEVVAILTILEDITEETKAAKEKQKLMDIMNHQSRMAEMGAMIGIIVHQWKQPLNVISLVSQNVIEDVREGIQTDESLIKDMEMVLENTYFLSQTITDFSDFFKKTKTVSTFPINRLLKDVFHLIDRQFEKNGVRVVFDDSCSFEITGYKNELKQVFLNLFNNARDALADSHIGNGKVTVRCQKGETTGTIYFSDNGGGIAPELMPDKIFEPYVTTKGEGGSGIGLYVCRSIITENMGGTIQVYNKDGGAVFEITLPLKMEQPEEEN